MASVPDGCSLQRPRESEQVMAERGFEDITLAYDCVEKFEVINGAKATMYSN